MARVVSKKKKTWLRPYRVLAAVLAVYAFALLTRHADLRDALQKQNVAKAEASEAYYAAWAQNNALKNERAEVNTDEFVERTARRKYGYCWYGETVYTVGNLEEILSAQAAFDTNGRN